MKNKLIELKLFINGKRKKFKINIATRLMDLRLRFSDLRLLLKMTAEIRELIKEIEDKFNIWRIS